MFVEVWWFILLPVLFGLGWFAARLDSRSGPRDDALPGAYFKGLNFLLNEQPDKAIDAFVDVVQLEPETIELHFALGSLFRRRGETERAIRVHKNLVERNDLTEVQREHALYELGQDYLKSGLLDRAEDAFDRLQGSQYRAAALDHRLHIAQMVRDWPQAVELAEQIERQPGESRKSIIAHFHCEQAAVLTGVGSAQPTAGSSAQADNTIPVNEALNRAAAADPEHARPWLLRGELSWAVGDADGAITAWQRAFELGPRFAALVALPWLQAHRQAGTLTAGVAALEAIQASHPSVDVMTALHDVRAHEQGATAANEYLKAALQETPSLLGYQQLVSSRLSAASGDLALVPELELSQQLIKQQVARLSRYVCGHCGFSARRYYWCCPGCSRWDSYSPRRAEELERG